MNEATWQEQFIDLAHRLGWKHMFVRRSIGKGRRWTTATNVPGWPDLHLWNERQQRLIFVELKSMDGTVEPDQAVLHGELVRSGCEVFVLRPYPLEVAQAVLTSKWAASPHRLLPAGGASIQIDEVQA